VPTFAGAVHIAILWIVDRAHDVKRRSEASSSAAGTRTASSA